MENQNWAFPAHLQPKPGAYGFNLESALDSVVLLRAEIPEDAFTASFLGTERVGNGVVIRDDGLVLTIGYLVTEASAIWLTTNEGAVVPAYTVSYDQSTGFALVQALGRLKLAPLPRGSAASCRVGDEVLVAGHGGRPHTVKAKVVDKREFAGYWEYVLDEALFTAPPHPQWGGSALIDARGRLAGIGSLLVQEDAGGGAPQGNMIVPIDLLEPILDDMVNFGRAQRPPRAWLGIYAAEVSGQLAIAGVTANGPAAEAGVKVGDVVVEVQGKPVKGLANLFRAIWDVGPAGVTVELTVARKGKISRLSVRSADRQNFLKKPLMH
ncbi:MAG: signal protein PDZ [Betaproteobacteria bacterium RIFCSPLOWO2_02_FULL_65_24]|nr:MAG: signal protein PDZ [Betaproteobacteria bacterium RIFCSPLOWO2_02_FULL_65_24]